MTILGGNLKEIKRKPKPCIYNLWVTNLVIFSLTCPLCLCKHTHSQTSVHTHTEHKDAWILFISKRKQYIAKVSAPSVELDYSNGHLLLSLKTKSASIISNLTVFLIYKMRKTIGSISQSYCEEYILQYV